MRGGELYGRRENRQGTGSESNKKKCRPLRNTLLSIMGKREEANKNGAGTGIKGTKSGNLDALLPHPPPQFQQYLQSTVYHEMCQKRVNLLSVSNLYWLAHTTFGLQIFCDVKGFQNF